MTRYLSLAEYLWLSEQVTGISADVLSQSGRIELADSALHAPMSGFGDEDFFPDLIASFLLNETPSEEQLAGYDPVTKWEFIVPRVPKELFIPRVINKTGPEPDA